MCLGICINRAVPTFMPAMSESNLISVSWSYSTQLYDALRLLGHAVVPPQRDPATGVPLKRSASAGANLSRASSAGSNAVPAAPATAEAFWDALKKVGRG
jgi:hypothetical protein